MNDKLNKWQLTVGLEVHIQLSTKTKMFCTCHNKYGQTPNTLICPVCLGLPGALPKINKEAINMAIALGHALNFNINSNTEFSRKKIIIILICQKVIKFHNLINQFVKMGF